jgi:pimeloyl-ACP methyl ester carboxylesterase
VQYPDWGLRSSRWSGIRSEIVDVRGVPVHYLATDTEPAAAGAPTHLLVHAMAGSATGWLDLIPPLTALGLVIAPDLPGTLAGHTPSPTRRGPRAETNARFLRAFVRTLDVGKIVVHGWSMGGLVSVLFADLAPQRIVGLVLTAPTLPWRRTSTIEALGWHTIGRVAILLGTPIARTVLRLFAGPLLARKRSALANLEALVAAPGHDTNRPPHTITDLEAAWFGKRDLVGGDPTRLTPDLVSVWTDDLRAVLSRPQRLPGAATALASAMSAMFVDRRPVERALNALAVPTLLLWGDDDPLIDRPTLEGHARRPLWETHVMDGTGHLLPVELPEAYADIVAGWLQQSDWRSQESDELA